jgi:hypothetical protein
VRDLVVRVGGRLLAQDVSVRVIERVATAIGIKVTRRIIGGGIARWLPVVGAVGVGAYAWYDTRQVARTAIRLFGKGPSNVDKVLAALDAEEAALAAQEDAPSRSRERA